MEPVLRQHGRYGFLFSIQAAEKRNPWFRIGPISCIAKAHQLRLMQIHNGQRLKMGSSAMGNGVRTGKSTGESLGHLAYWLAKRCPQVNDEICERLLQLEFADRTKHYWFTIQDFGIYRRRASDRRERIGIKSDEESRTVLRRIDGKVDVLERLFSKVSRSAAIQFRAAMDGQPRDRGVRRTVRSSSNGVNPTDLSDIEGLKTEMRVLKSTRSRALREAAFNAAEGVCGVCGRDFSTLLGGRGVRVLQVHHRHQLAARKAPAVTKQSDLAVVCANCHMLLHLDPKKALRIGKLKAMLRADVPRRAARKRTAN